MVTTPYAEEFTQSAWHLYVIRFQRRDELMAELGKMGVETLIHYPVPIHKQKAYSNLTNECFQLTEKLSEEILSLPIYYGLENQQIEIICNHIKSLLS
jgi:dTDP-4-amino-4,6-dideoxygalactose transaminase